MRGALLRFWRRRPIPVYVTGGAMLAGILLAIVPFGSGTKPLGKAVFALFLWLFAIACVAAVAWTVELVAGALRWARARDTAPAAARPIHHTGPLPELSAGKQAHVRRAVKLLTEAGIFREKLDPALLYPGVAEREAPVKPDIIFEALIEAAYYHPAFDPAPYRANLVLHETQVEQPEAYLVEQIADLARLSGGALAIADVAVVQSWRADKVTVDTRIAMTVNGEAVTLAYPGDDTDLSTVLHHDLATRLRALGTGHRLAWLWSDAGPWISCLPDGAVERLNDAFRLSAKTNCQWVWIDEEPAHAAGAIATLSSG